ncbi:hypothetical protein N5P37_006322 [Trichoderma harzianum]|nr:hypothetical protein N5P37_006322 [Trichoderma harzianum]
MKPIQFLTLATVLSQGAFACLEHLLQERTPDPNDMIRRQEPAPRTKTAIKNVRVFDGTKLTGLQTVIIDGENISNDTSNIETTVDGNGGVLIPGLIDCHVHISNVAGLETLTSYGVTTAMVMACRNYTQCAPLRNLEGVASFVSAGVPATGPGSQHSRTFNLSSQYLIYPDANATEVVSYTFGNGSDFSITSRSRGGGGGGCRGGGKGGRCCSKLKKKKKEEEKEKKEKEGGGRIKLRGGVYKVPVGYRGGRSASGTLSRK